METKPFNLQSPEQIAKDYGGNKQKIAQAASMGMVDPTAAVLAGMFIDRIRSAQMMEQQPQGTVAQQVFAPPQPPMAAPPQGAPPMGAPPMAAPQGAPPMGAPTMGAPPMEAPQAPPVQPPGMAMGGLMDLSVPDDMFEEPMVDAQNFAGGGLVAFAQGDAVQEDEEEEPFRREYKPGERIPFADSLLGRGLGMVSDTIRGTPEARAAALRARKEYEASATSAVDYARKRDAYRLQGLAAPLVGGDVPIHPNLRPMSPAPAARDPAYKGPPVTADALRSLLAKPGASTASGGPAAPTRTAMAAPATAPRGLGELAAAQGAAPRAVSAPLPGAPSVPGAPVAPGAPAGPQGMQAGVEEYMRLQKQYGGDAATPYRDRLAAAAEAQLDPKAIAAQKKQDMWQAVAQFGFNMAATNSPYFMQAAGQAGVSTVPFMAASSKARKAAEKDALKQLADIEGLSAAEKKQALQSGVAYAQNLADDQRQDSQFSQTMGLAERKFAFEKQEAAASRAAAAAARRGSGGIGAPDFPGGEFGAFATSRYQDIMALMGDKLKADPRAMAAYTADPAGYLARYRRVAYREALRLGKQDAEKEGGNGGTRSRPRPGAPAPSSSTAKMSDAQIRAELGL